MNFKLILDKWNLVSEKGLPEDGTWCFVAWKNCTGEYEWAIGGYQEAEHQSMSILAWEEWFLKRKRLSHGRNFSKMKFLQRSKENLQRKEEYE